MADVFLATFWYRAEKPYGVGKTANERHSYIVPGWRGEIVDGLKDHEFVYTGVCKDKAEAKAELIAHLKKRGYSGILRAI